MNDPSRKERIIHIKRVFLWVACCCHDKKGSLSSSDQHGSLKNVVKSSLFVRERKREWWRRERERDEIKNDALNKKENAATPHSRSFCENVWIRFLFSPSIDRFGVIFCLLLSVNKSPRITERERETERERDRERERKRETERNHKRPEIPRASDRSEQLKANARAGKFRIKCTVYNISAEIVEWPLLFVCTVITWHVLKFGRRTRGNKIVDFFIAPSFAYLGEKRKCKKIFLPFDSFHSSFDPKTPVAVIVSLQITPL